MASASHCGRQHISPSCLAVAEEGLRLTEGNPAVGADQVGLSPSLGFSFFHGGVLSLTGYPREGEAELDRVIEIARTSRQLSVVWVAQTFRVLCCEVTGEVSAAMLRALEAVDYAERTATQNGRIMAYGCLGIANVLNGAWHAALEVLERALTIRRERRLQVWEGEVLATMAAAHLGLGDREQALAFAVEAIEVCRRSGTRLWEFPAQLTRIRAFREIRGVQATKEVESALAEAEAWLERSGAKSYEPFLHVERAEVARLSGDDGMRQRELREAHRLFTEIGAPIRAKRVAKELAR
jgi:tetratricopeptide (TPR) repeat protein